MTAETYNRNTLKRLHTTTLALLMALLGFLTTACDNSELWDEVPGEISTFIDQYFPNSALESVSHSGSTYHVRIKNGPGLAFDASYKWTDINGYGMPLPQVLLFDQLPPRLYDYLQETQQLNEVFSMSRDGSNYNVSLLSSSLQFDASSGMLTGSDAAGSAAKNAAGES